MSHRRNQIREDERENELEVLQLVEQYKDKALFAPDIWESEVVEATIKDVIIGLCDELIPFERIKRPEIAERLQRYRGRKCVQFVLEVDGQEYTTFPTVISNHPNSKFMRIMKRYGASIGAHKVLTPGMKVKVMFDQRGRIRIVTD